MIPTWSGLDGAWDSDHICIEQPACGTYMGFAVALGCSGTQAVTSGQLLAEAATEVAPCIEGHRALMLEDCVDIQFRYDEHELSLGDCDDIEELETVSSSLENSDRGGPVWQQSRQLEAPLSLYDDAGGFCEDSGDFCDDAEAFCDDTDSPLDDIQVQASSSKHCLNFCETDVGFCEDTGPALDDDELPASSPRELRLQAVSSREVNTSTQGEEPQILDDTHIQTSSSRELRLNALPCHVNTLIEIEAPKVSRICGTIGHLVQVTSVDSDAVVGL